MTFFLGTKRPHQGKVTAIGHGSYLTPRWLGGENSRELAAAVSKQKVVHSIVVVVSFICLFGFRLAGKMPNYMKHSSKPATQWQQQKRNCHSTSQTVGGGGRGDYKCHVIPKAHLQQASIPTPSNASILLAFLMYHQFVARHNSLSKPFWREPWRLGDAAVGRWNAGWTASKSGRFAMASRKRRGKKQQLNWICSFRVIAIEGRSRDWNELSLLV